MFRWAYGVPRAAAKGYVAWLLLLATLLMASAVQAQSNPRYAGIVVDAENGEVLYSENADAPRFPASLTKMMTLYLTFEALNNGSLSLNQELPVSSQAAAMPASKLWLAAGSTITVDNAIRALTVRSANDVAVVLAEALGSSERQFANLMTEKARAIGMLHTTFRNASGLPDDAQSTTARDMVILSARLIQDFPEYYPYFSLSEFTFRGTRHTSHNRLVGSYPGADGLKTGFIRASGFNVATTAVHDGRRMIAVVMGGFSAQSRDTHMADLLDRSFLRAGLRDQPTWLADTHFSREFMSFGGDAPVQPPSAPSRSPQGPGQSSALLATVDHGAPRAQVAAPAQASIPAPSTPPPTQDDPLRAFIEREQVMAGMAPAPSSTRRSAASDWGIQVGAFSQAAQAHQYAEQAASRLPGDVSGQVEVDNVENRVYRARLMALDEPGARHACEALRAQGMDCMVVNASL